MILNVADYLSVQSAFDAAVDGDSVYFPAIAPWIAPPQGWAVSKSLEIYGDGPGDLANGLGTILKPATTPSGGVQPTGDVLILTPARSRLENVTVKDLTIVGQGNAPRYGIRFSPGTSQLSGLRLERLIISGMGTAGISLIGNNVQGQDVVSVFMSRVEVLDCAGVGVDLLAAFQVYMDRCTLARNGKGGSYPQWANPILGASQLNGYQSQVAMYFCELDGTGAIGAGGSGLAPPPLSLQAGTLARVDTCRFLGFASAGRAVRFADPGIIACIGASDFELSSYASAALGIEVPATAQGFPSMILILPNRFAGLGKAVAIASGARMVTVFPQAYIPVSGSQPPTIDLPAFANDAPFALPSLANPSGNSVAGLLLPSYTSDPPTSLPSGTLYYNAGLRVLVDGQWKVAQTS